jgi:hypothetical protein
MIIIFCDFRQFSAKKLAFFSKTNVMINFFQNLALFWVKNANIFAKFFGANILKIITSVLDQGCSTFLSSSIRLDGISASADWHHSRFFQSVCLKFRQKKTATVCLLFILIWVCMHVKNWAYFTYRVTKLGDVSPTGWLLTCLSFFKD